MIWFTADTHFNHDNILAYSRRPFADLAEMTERMIGNWNAVVKPGDQVYHLGDFALSFGKRDAALIDSLLSRLNGQKHLLAGNHDRDEVTRNKRWQTVRHYHELAVDLGGPHRQRIVLCHYAMRVWNQSHRGAFMLHGHSHGSLSDIGGKIRDVGVDCCNYAPISVEEVAAFMASREAVTVDHHSAV